MTNYLIVACGSALGGMARYWAANLSLPGTVAGFPTGTLVVNALGSFFIGYFAVTLAKVDGPTTDHLRLFFMVGVFGGFTTFSAFSLQTLTLLQTNQTFLALLYIGLSLGLCLVAVAFGYWTGKL